MWPNLEPVDLTAAHAADQTASIDQVQLPGCHQLACHQLANKNDQLAAC
jgi:hypothetical protein